MTRARDTSQIFRHPVGIHSSGTDLTASGRVHALNFVGTGNTFAHHTTTGVMDISIEGGGGTTAGSRINYPDGTKSPFMLSLTHLNQNMILDNATTGETVDCNIVIAESQMVIDAGIGLTIGKGKKTIPDLYKVVTPKYTT